MLEPAVRRFLLVALAALSLLVPASIAVAGKPSGGGGKGGGKPPAGTHTISLVLLESTDGLPHYGQRIEFSVSTTATTQPWVVLECYQGRTLVAQGRAAYFDGAISGRDFELASPKWTGGEADCTAKLTTPEWTVLTSMTFHVHA